TFDGKLDDELLEKAKARGYRLRDIVIIASLIEKETDGTDHANIASVIYNRLKDTGVHGTYGMLQIDASVLYGLPGHVGGLTQEDLKTDTPYNLYLHAGLPPTPIANPGVDSLNAAMEPNETDYYYYALGKDGKHHFSTTLEEHNRFVASDEYGG
ncbi:MAG: endolytic transglycosylase MltG, partial [Oscillibacter sp.]|nr:endolytic transglycosylase MltG [Oscillibacter sp.]